MSQVNDASVYEAFMAHHEPQLRLSGVPEKFYKKLIAKLNSQIFDAGTKKLYSIL